MNVCVIMFFVSFSRNNHFYTFLYIHTCDSIYIHMWICVLGSQFECVVWVYACDSSSIKCTCVHW